MVGRKINSNPNKFLICYKKCATYLPETREGGRGGGGVKKLSGESPEIHPFLERQSSLLAELTRTYVSHSKAVAASSVISGIT